MKLRTRRSPLLFALAVVVPSLALNVAADESAALENVARGITVDTDVESVLKPRDSVGTKDAPVDGQDGLPHEGPWVDQHHDHDHDDAMKNLPPLQGRPDDALAGIPETNDGVMDDSSRPKPKEGTTGTGGGISERGWSDDKTDNVPEAPKEAPHPPPTEEERAMEQAEQEHGDLDQNSGPGLAKPDNLPDTPHGETVPIPDPADMDHLDISDPLNKGSTSLADTDEEDDGIIQPFHSFVLSLTMILVSEVGDKTFLVAALMAMKHDRMVVFSAAFSALLVMTVLSAVLGHTVPSLIPKQFTSFAAAILFFVFGAKLLREGMAMDPNEGVSEELHEVERELAEKEQDAATHGRNRGNSHAVTPYALEMGLGNGQQIGAGDRKGRSQSRLASPPRSPSTSPSRSRSRGRYGASATSLAEGVNNLLSLLLSPAWVQTFVMTFLGEWGDRSQIATIAMAAGQDYWWVTFGAMTGHCVCTGVAVIGGRAIAGKVSLKVVTVGGALAFLLFGFIYGIEAIYD